MMLTQKETTLLQDLKKEEETCIEKYNQYSQQASAPQLKNLFSQLAQKEQQHLNTVNQMLSGTAPTMSASQGGQSQTQSQSTSQQVNMSSQNYDMKNDSYLCTDALSTEKHVSSTYNTSIFEFKNKDMRNALNHIQKEEQEHGEQIFNYMSQNNMYN